MSLPGTPQGEVSHLEPSGPAPMETLHVNQSLELHVSVCHVHKTEESQQLNH